MLTVDGDLDLALIGGSHSVVGDAFVVLGLLPLDLRDVQELTVAHQPVCGHQADGSLGLGTPVIRVTARGGLTTNSWIRGFTRTGEAADIQRESSS